VQAKEGDEHHRGIDGVVAQQVKQQHGNEHGDFHDDPSGFFVDVAHNRQPGFFGATADRHHFGDKNRQTRDQVDDGPDKNELFKSRGSDGIDGFEHDSTFHGLNVTQVI
jgi:hypothetical protein